MTRKRWWLLLGIVATVGLAYLLVMALTPAPRFIFGSTPIGPDEALLLTRRNDGDATNFWVQLVADDGTVTWSREVTPFETSEALGSTAVAASADRIVLLGARQYDSREGARARRR